MKLLVERALKHNIWHVSKINILMMPDDCFWLKSQHVPEYTPVFLNRRAARGLRKLQNAARFH